MPYSSERIHIWGFQACFEFLGSCFSPNGNSLNPRKGCLECIRISSLAFGNEPDLACFGETQHFVDCQSGIYSAFAFEIRAHLIFGGSFLELVFWEHVQVFVPQLTCFGEMSKWSLCSKELNFSQKFGLLFAYQSTRRFLCFSRKTHASNLANSKLVELQVVEFWKFAVTNLENWYLSEDRC